ILTVVWIAAAGVTPAAGAQVTAPAAPPPGSVTSTQVLTHVTQTVEWYQLVTALGQSGGLTNQAVDRDRLRQTSITAVQFAFDFANAAASLMSSAPQSAAAAAAADSSNDAARMQRMAARLATRVDSLQSRIKTLDAAVANAQPAARDTLTARRAQVAATLNLTLAVQGTVAELQQFAAKSAAQGPGGATSLTSQIADLQRSVPETRRPTGTSSRGATASSSGTDTGAASGAPAGTATSGTASDVRPASGGLIPLISEWFALRGVRRQVKDAIRVTDALSSELDTLRRGVSRQVGSLVRSSMADTGSATPGSLAAAQKTTEAATARFRKLSTVLVPLGEQDITVDDARGTLAELSGVFRTQSASVARDIAFRAIVLAACIALVLLISELWRRATFRYLHDTRRRRQFLLLRRVLVVIALLVILFLGFVSEIGSLATYV
ncbi:MAG: hypothetical protein ACRENC_12435, partial [Gemmatimonadaceae bacterium]